MSIHSYRGLSLDGGFGDGIAPLWFLVTFDFGGTFSLCSTQEFSSSQPHELLEHLQLWGFKASISYQSVSPSCERNNIVVCAVWYLEVTQTSRAANMAIHVLLWICMFVNMWKWLTKRKDHLKLPTFTLSKTGPLLYRFH